jgi:hypothetical protein
MCRPPQLVFRPRPPSQPWRGPRSVGARYRSYFLQKQKVVCMEQPSPFRDEYPVEESHGPDANCRRALAAAQRVSVRARASYWGNKIIDTTSLWVRSHTEKTKDLNAPLAPALPAGDESFNFPSAYRRRKKRLHGFVGCQRPSDVSGSGITLQTCSSTTEARSQGRNRT